MKEVFEKLKGWIKMVFQVKGASSGHGAWKNAKTNRISETGVYEFWVSIKDSGTFFTTGYVDVDSGSVNPGTALPIRFSYKPGVEYKFNTCMLVVNNLGECITGLYDHAGNYLSPGTADDVAWRKLRD